MDDDQEKTTTQLYSVSPTEEHYHHPRCIADVAHHKEDELFEVFLFIHGYGLGTLHLCLAIFVLFMFYKLWFTLRRRRPFIAVIHFLILFYAIVRVISSMAKGYVHNVTFFFFIQLTGDLGIPALTSAYALTVWVMFEIANFQRSKKLQNKTFLAIIIVSHFIFIIVVDIVVGLYNGACMLLLICQIFNVVWGAVLTTLFLIATIRLYKMRHRQEESFRPRVFSKPVLNLATESLASIALPMNRESFQEINRRSNEIVSQSSPNVFPFILNVISPRPIDEDTSGPAVDRNLDIKDSTDQLSLRKGGLRSHDRRSNTSSSVTNVHMETQINEKVISSSDMATMRETDRIEIGSKTHQIQVAGEEISQPNDSSGKQMNVGVDETDTFSETSPNISLPAKEATRSQVTHEMFDVDNNSIITKKSNNFSEEGKEISRIPIGPTRIPNKNRNNEARKSKFVSTRRKNPTKKLETVGILSAILGIAQVLMGFIGTGYIYNPQLVGTTSEPNPLAWLLFTTILRLLELLFGLVLTFLAWQRK